MPSEITFKGGGSVKVIADLPAVREAMAEGLAIIDTARFAGFRGDEAVGGEPVVVVLGAIACVLAISGP